jgi:hypothetical protein
MFCPNPDCDDRLETGRPGEYAAGVTVCPVCGARLVSERPAGDGEHAATGSSHSTGDDLETVFETADPTEVPVVTALLRSEGIDCLVLGEESFDPFRGALSPLRFNPLAGRARVAVAREDAGQAREVLRHLVEDG